MCFHSNEYQGVGATIVAPVGRLLAFNISASWASSLHIWDLPDSSITGAYSLNEICSACTRIWLAQFLCRALTNTLLELCSFLSVCLKPALCLHSLPQPPQYHSPAVPMTHRPIINLRLLFATLSASSLHSRVSPNPTSSSQGLPRMNPISGAELTKRTWIDDC